MVTYTACTVSVCHIHTRCMSCVSDRQAAAAADPAAAQDQRATAADPGQLLSRPPRVPTYPGQQRGCGE